MYIYSQWDKMNEKGVKEFHGFLTEPQFSEPRKMLNAETWTLAVNYLQETYTLYRGQYWQGFPTGGGVLVGKGTDTPDTTYANWPEWFENILSKHGLKAWEPPEGWQWPEFVPDEAAS